MIGIIDYGMGNLRSVLKAIEFLGGEGRVTARAEELDACKKLILPGVGFFDHMLELFTVHGRLNVTLSCRGDLQVDAHHTVEDVGIALGDCFRQALGDKKGIARFADRLVPMDDVAALVAVDFSGRPALIFEEALSGRVGNFDMELVEEFLRAFTAHAGFNLYVKLLRCGNRHHEAEAIFKALRHSHCACATR